MNKAENGICPESPSERADMRHCWHYSNNMLLSNPPQIQKTCCWCGEKETEFVWKSHPSDKCHGEHMPRG